MTLTVATYNIAAGLSDGLFKKKNYYKSADVIKNLNADIITLNEVGKPIPEYIEEHAAFLAGYCGYKYFAFAKATTFSSYPYGNAILSRYPLKNIKIIPVRRFINIFPGIYEPRCILTAEVQSEKPFRIICTHLGLMPDERKMGISKVAEQLAVSKKPTVFMGDLNINGNNKTTVRPLRKWLRDVCENRNLKTFPAKKPKKRLDYIFISGNIYVDDVFTVDSVASDHLPLVAKISL